MMIIIIIIIHVIIIIVVTDILPVCAYCVNSSDDGLTSIVVLLLGEISLGD